MRKIKFRNIRKKSKRRFLIVIITLIAIFFTIFFADGQFRPMIKTIAANKASTEATILINNVVAKELSEYGYTYTSLVGIDKNQNGVITNIAINTVSLNIFQARITSEVQKAISTYGEQTIKIPVGTLFGSDFLIGRGPKISFKMTMSSNVTSCIKSVFEDAGINQTRHQIVLNIISKLYAVIPWYSTATKICSNFVIAETVIVGPVPDAFTEVIETEDLCGDINDYGAGK